MFRKTIAIFLVTLYVVAMLKPFAPFMEYAVNYEYISTVLCVNKDKPKMECNGKCHLAKEVEEQQKEEKSAVNIDLKEYPIGFVKIIRLNKKCSSCNYKEDKFNYNHNYSYLTTYSFFHPPNV